jgi:GntR family transcriptional repressor for pyruvate dehydrogenase complex
METLSDKVVDQILKLIQSGELQVGDRLPGERRLAERLQVSRVPVREALSSLKALGLIDVRPGVGTIVISTPRALAQDSWLRWLSDHMNQILDIYEVREAIECQAARLAAERANHEDIEKLKQIHEKAKTSVAVDDYDGLMEADREFHLHIAGISGNELLLELVKMMDRISVLDRSATFYLPSRPNESIREHEAVVSNIASGDAIAAGTAASDHFKSIIARVRKAQFDSAAVVARGVS